MYVYNCITNHNTIGVRVKPNNIEMPETLTINKILATTYTSTIMLMLVLLTTYA